MALILGLLLVYCLGAAHGGWALYDWLRYRGRLESVETEHQRRVRLAIDDILDNLMPSPADVHGDQHDAEGIRQPTLFGVPVEPPSGPHVA